MKNATVQVIVEMHILWPITVRKLVCLILRLKCTKFDFSRWVSASDPSGELIPQSVRSSDPLSTFMGISSKGRQGEMKGRGKGSPLYVFNLTLTTNPHFQKPDSVTWAALAGGGEAAAPVPSALPRQAPRYSQIPRT